MNIARHPNRHRPTQPSSDLQRAAELRERNEQRLIAWHAAWAMREMQQHAARTDDLRRAYCSRRMTAQPA